MANQLPDFDPVNIRDRQQAEVTRLQTNFDRIQAVLEQLRGNLNSQATEINDLEAGGDGTLPAANITVDTSSFDQLLAEFTGTQAQELFDFIDGLTIGGGTALANVSLFASDQLSGRNEDIKTFITTANIFISYALTLREDLTSLLLVVNGVEVPIELPRDADIQTDYRVEISASSRNAIAAAITNDEIVSFLQGVRTDGTVVETSRLTLVEGGPVFVNSLYYDIVRDNDASLFSFVPAQNLLFDANNQATFSLGPAPQPDLSVNEDGQFFAFALPRTATLEVVSVENLDTPNVIIDEQLAFFPAGLTAGTPDGRTWDIYFAGPIIPGTTMQFRVTVRGLN